jgi:ribokinase
VSGRAPCIVVVGSVNLDMAASVSRLPVPGETVSGAELRRFPGGKGANQALAARRLGAEVHLVARVGDDAEADAALALLYAEGVDLSRCVRDATLATGIALIAIAPEGENLIVVAPGANRALRAETLELPAADALMCQLEVPADTLCRASERFSGFFCVNLAPAMDVPEAILQRADLIVVNETEAAFYGDALGACHGLIAVTRGSLGATLSKQNETIAKSKPPGVTPVDTTGAGDTFTAALTIALIEGAAPQQALDFACAAGALATTKCGAQPSMPYRKDVDAALART